MLLKFSWVVSFSVVWMHWKMCPLVIGSIIRFRDVFYFQPTIMYSFSLMLIPQMISTKTDFIIPLQLQKFCVIMQVFLEYSDNWRNIYIYICVLLMCNPTLRMVCLQQAIKNLWSCFTKNPLLSILFSHSNSTS